MPQNTRPLSGKSPKSQKNLATSVDLTGENIHWQQDISYSTYLGLNTLLSAQHPRSSAHDEMLFIIMHQTAELWMKACLHELRAACRSIANGALGPAFKMLARMSQIQANLKQSWDILSTMTPADYASFRDSLGQSSGFQSYQYRAIEFSLGNKNARLLDVHKNAPDIHGRLKSILDSPSLYDICLQALKNAGFDIPEDHLKRDYSQAYQPHSAVEAAWLAIYRSPERYWDLYELAEKLVDLEHHFHEWRFSHMKTVERIIGYKQGTGGTSGVSYLAKALDIRFFPELWTARTLL